MAPTAAAVRVMSISSQTPLAQILGIYWSLHISLCICRSHEEDGSGDALEQGKSELEQQRRDALSLVEAQEEVTPIMSSANLVCHMLVSRL